MTTSSRPQRHGSLRKPAEPAFDEAAAYQRLQKAAARIKRLPPEVMAVITDDAGQQVVSGGHNWDTGNVPVQTEPSRRQAGGRRR